MSFIHVQLNKEVRTVAEVVRQTKYKKLRRMVPGCKQQQPHCLATCFATRSRFLCPTFYVAAADTVVVGGAAVVASSKSKSEATCVLCLKLPAEQRLG